MSRHAWPCILVAAVPMLTSCGQRSGSTPEPEIPLQQAPSPGAQIGGEEIAGDQADQDGDDGSAETDEDGDGIPDGQDLCPHMTEENDGVDDLDGCPDLAKIEGCQIVVTEKIKYYGDPIIDHDSYDDLDVVAEIIKSNPELGVIRIEVHSGHWGTNDFNLALTEDRAEGVKDYLVKQGVPVESLIAIGYGEEKPIASNETLEGRAMNQRTEFHIVECEEK